MVISLFSYFLLKLLSLHPILPLVKEALFKTGHNISYSGRFPGFPRGKEEQGLGFLPGAVRDGASPEHGMLLPAPYIKPV